MGKKDIHASHYFSYNPFFADIANGYFFDGEQVIDPKRLQEGEKELLQATMVHAKRVIRDNVKKYYADTLLCIYVLEHQDKVDYHMVLRNMLAESMEYQRQWVQLRKKHLEEKSLESGAEYLSGMKKGDKFVPVISLVVYYGEEKWDAAKCLHDLLSLQHLPPLLKKYIENYHIHVFDYHDYENFDMFHTELKQVFTFLKYSSDKRKLQKIIAEHPEEYYNMSKEAYALLAAVTHSTEFLHFDDDSKQMTGGINVCKALEDIRLEGIEIGIQALVEDYQEVGFSKDTILDRVQKRFSLSEAQAEEYFERFALPEYTS